MSQPSQNPVIGYFVIGSFFVVGMLLVVFPASAKNFYDRWPVGVFGRPMRLQKIWHFRILGIGWMIGAIMGTITIYNVTH